MRLGNNRTFYSPPKLTQCRMSNLSRGAVIEFQEIAAHPTGADLWGRCRKPASRCQNRARGVQGARCTWV